MALATRSGPEWVEYPMGREADLTPITWDEGDWPILSPSSGVVTGWPLSPSTRLVPG
jgi:hypothetical protein